MKARGNTKVILQKVGEIQDLIGEALALHYDDQNRFGFDRGQKKLEQAHEKCIEIRDMYDPI